MLYRTSIELVGCDVVNSTYLPLPVSVTASRPTASPARVSQLRFFGNTTPFVVAFAASCSTNGTGAPRPAVSDGADPATVGISGVGGVLGVRADDDSSHCQADDDDDRNDEDGGQPPWADLGGGHGASRWHAPAICRKISTG